MNEFLGSIFLGLSKWVNFCQHKSKQSIRYVLDSMLDFIEVMSKGKLQGFWNNCNNSQDCAYVSLCNCSVLWHYKLNFVKQWMLKLTTEVIPKACCRVSLKQMQDFIICPRPTTLFIVLNECFEDWLIGLMYVVKTISHCNSWNINEII